MDRTAAGVNTGNRPDSPRTRRLRRRTDSPHEFQINTGAAVAQLSGQGLTDKPSILPPLRTTTANHHTIMGPIGMPELVMIFIIALLLFGAKKLPELARGIGKATGEFKKAREDFEREITHAVHQAETEAVTKPPAAAVPAPVATAAAAAPVATESATPPAAGHTP